MCQCCHPYGWPIWWATTLCKNGQINFTLGSDANFFQNNLYQDYIVEGLESLTHQLCMEKNIALAQWQELQLKCLDLPILHVLLYTLIY
jgi:hypothetical protein